MKAQFLSQITTQPWDMDRLRARTIIGNIVCRFLRSDRPETDIYGDPLPCMQILGDVAIIPLCGVLSINVPTWIKSYGFNLTDANDLAAELDSALADPAVALIVIDCDSPGGMSLSGAKLFSLFEAANKKKPVFAWCGDGKMMCSAAYNTCAAAAAILVGPYAAAVGSIGSYMVMLDDSKYWEAIGVTVEVFRSGEFKGIGEDALTDDQRVYLQSLADQAGTAIRANVQKYRTDIAVENLQGQWFSGMQSVSLGFAAGTAKDLNAAIARFRKMI